MCYTNFSMDNENATPNQPETPSDSNPNIQSAEPNTPPEAAQPQPANELQDVKKELGSYERATLKWTSIIVGINLLTCLFVYLQWREMKSGSADTHDLAIAAETQAGRMKNMSDAAEKIQRAAENMVVQEQRIADNAKASLDASSRQSRAALDATIGNSRREQRAWINITFGEVTWNEGDPIYVPITTTNVGKTPAKNYFLHAVVRLVPNNLEAEEVLSSFPYQGIPHFQSFVGMMPPGGTHTGTATSYDQNSNARILSKEELSEMDTGRAFIVVYAEVRYTDIFGVDHWTRSCVYTKDPSVHAVYASKCPLYDDIDNN